MAGHLVPKYFAQYTGHVITAPNSPGDMVVFDFLIVTHFITAKAFLYHVVPTGKHTHTHTCTHSDSFKLKT